MRRTGWLPFLMLLCGCARVVLPTSAPSPTGTPTPSPTFTPAPTITSTATPTHTLTPIPTNTPTPTPTFTPVYLAYGPKGVGDAWQNWATPGAGANLDALRFDWYYDWTWTYLPERGDDNRYVRTVWCDLTSQQDINGVSHTLVDTARQDFLTNRRGRVWLVYNEPDDPAQCGGRRSPADTPIFLDPAYAARHFSQVYDEIKGADPYARVFAGGMVWVNTGETRAWWRAFVSTLRADGHLNKLEGVHLHLYPFVSSSTKWGSSDFTCYTEGYCAPALAKVADYWYRHMHLGLGLRDLPIWITETGWLHCGPEFRELTPDRIMRPLAQWFSGDAAWPYASRAPVNPGYDAIAWYVTRDPGWFPCTYLLDGLGADGAPTALGEFWNEYMPSAGKP